MKRTTIALLLLGVLQMAGELAHLPALKGIGAATAASPAPKVFSAVRGLETYSTRFYLEWTHRDGRAQELELTPELYSRLRGPYNRRNVFGAALAYGPVLVTDPRTRALFDNVARHALCGAAPVLAEMGFDPAERRGPVRIRYRPRPGVKMGDLPRILEVPCR